MTNSARPVTRPRRVDTRRSVQPAVGRRLRASRERRGVSQQRLADLIGITQAALSNYETGKRDLPLATFVRLASALDAPLGDLLGLTPRTKTRRAAGGTRSTTRPAARATSTRSRAASTWSGRGSGAEAAS
ncbi:MAG: helix-turn-helix transcriptional regulator [Dehalococcoidia bacterium]